MAFAKDPVGVWVGDRLGLACAQRMRCDKPVLRPQVVAVQERDEASTGFTDRIVSDGWLVAVRDLEEARPL